MYELLCKGRDTAKIRHRTSGVLMLAHRLRRWPTLNPTLLQRIMFAREGVKC